MGYKTTRHEIGTHRGHTLYKGATFEVDGITTPKLVDEFVGMTVKGGNFKRKQDRYEFFVNYEGTAKSMIDLIEDQEEIILTESEHRKWVTGPNSEHQWGFNKQSMLRLLNDYKKEKCPRRRKGYVERLYDANFHLMASALEDENYEEFNKLFAECFD